jgi:hypothetical protein
LTTHRTFGTFARLICVGPGSAFFGGVFGTGTGLKAVTYTHVGTPLDFVYLLHLCCLAFWVCVTLLLLGSRAFVRTTSRLSMDAQTRREDKGSRGLWDDTAILVDVSTQAFKVTCVCSTQACIAICVSEEVVRAFEQRRTGQSEWLRWSFQDDLLPVLARSFPRPAEPRSVGREVVVSKVEEVLYAAETAM